MLSCFFFFFFQAEDGIRDLVRSRGLGDVYKRQVKRRFEAAGILKAAEPHPVLLESISGNAYPVVGLSLIHI